MQERFIPTEQDIIATTQGWLEQAVIGLNLCPFAKSVFIKDQVRYVVSQSESTADLTAQLHSELMHLHATDPDITDTTLLIHPYVLQDFLDYNDYLDIVDEVIVETGLEGIIQVASFHPAYQFAGTEEDDPGNLTNRSPYPILHLIREDSIARAVSSFPDASTIFERNIRTVEKLGLEQWEKFEFVVSRKQQEVAKI